VPDTAIVEQWWAVSMSEPKEQYDLVSGSRSISVPAILGLSPGASGISSIADVIGKSQFDRLERGETNIVYLSSQTAGDLSVKEGDTIRMGGIDVTVAGVFDAKAFDEKVVSLSGQQIAPLRYTVGGIDGGGRKLEDTAAESLDLG